MGLVSRVFGGAPERMAFTARREPTLTRSGSVGSDNAGVWTDNWVSSPSMTGVQINQQTALQVSAVMGCVSIVSEDVAKLAPALWRKRSDGGRDKVKNHPLVPLLSRPNDWQTWYEFCQQQVAALMLRGNAFTVILRNGRGDPTMLVPINPDKVTLWEAPSGDLFFVVTRTGLHELAVLRSVPAFVPYADVLHWKGLSGNGLLGVSKISLAREAIGLAAAMEQLASRTIGNGARPSGIMTTDKKVTPEVAKQIKEAWQQNQAGLANGGKLLVLEEGLKWQPLALSFADMQFIASRHYQNADIAKIFRIPNYMIGEDSKVSRANIVQQSQEYLNNTLMSYVDIIQQRFSFTFDLGDDLFVELDLDKILRADIMTRYAAWRIGQTGWLTTNEIRISEGMNPVEGGDEIMRQVNVAPLNSDVFLGTPTPDIQDPNAPVDPNAPPAGPGSDVTGTGGAGGGNPPDDGSDPAPSD
jgi:HK97 family phage portal protein